jgi:hypothetical protein
VGEPRHARSSLAASGPGGGVCRAGSSGCTRRRQGLCNRGKLGPATPPRGGGALLTSGSASHALRRTGELRTMASAASAALASLAASSAARAWLGLGLGLGSGAGSGLGLGLGLG